MAEGWPDADFCLDAPLRSPTNRNSFLGQHRTIPALRLKHRFGGSGTASALPKCSIMSGCGTRIVLRGQKPLALCDHCTCFGSLYPPLAALTFAAQSIICAFGLASAAPRSPYRHLELCGIALGVPYSAANIPNKNKNETATAPYRFFKKKEKNRTSCRRLHRMETTPLQVDAVPWESAGRSGILPLYPIGKALAFDA